MLILAGYHVVDPKRRYHASEGQDAAVVPVVLAVLAELALSTGRRIVDPLAAEAACLERGVGHDQWFSTVLALKADGSIALKTAPPSQVVLLAATNAGILRHLETAGADLGAVRQRLKSRLQQAPRNEPLDLAAEVDAPALLVECLLDGWVDQRLLVYSAAPGRRFRIHGVHFSGEGQP